MRINQNISAVIVNDQLLRNEDSLAESVKRLSSGFKFNSAKDNPSGVAISYKMQAQINALNRASSNTTDGISIVQTIDGAMGEIGDIIQRISELCVQAANGTNSVNDRKAIQMEIDSLKEEIDRISEDTEFNGKTLLNGTLDRRTYVTTSTQVRVDTAGTIFETKEVSAYNQVDNIIISDSVQSGHYQMTITQPQMHAVMVGGERLTPTAVVTINNADGSTTPTSAYPVPKDGWVEINGVLAKIKKGMEPKDVYKALVEAGEIVGVNVFIQNGATVTQPVVNNNTLDSQGYPTVSIEDNANYDPEYPFLFVSKEYGSESKVEIACSDDIMKGILGLGDTQLDQNDGMIQAPQKDKDGNDTAIIMTTTYGKDLQVIVDTTDPKLTNQVVVKTDGSRVTITDKGGFEMKFEVSAAINATEQDPFKFDIEATDIGTLQLQVGANEDQELNVRVPEINTKTMFMRDLDVTVEGGSEKGIDQTDVALSIVSAARSKMGAYQNSLEFSKSSLDATIEDMTTAISRLGDTDMAAEMTTYTNANVLTQASISVLAQANDLPQQVLSLLQG